MASKIGGQAVIEGVMMRNQERFAVAVRLPNGTIRIKKEKTRHFPKFFTIVFIRGIVGLAFTLVDGMKALTWSSNQQMGKDEKMTTKEIAFTLTVSLLFAVLLFIGAPFLLAKLLTSSEGILFNGVDGIFRVVAFLGYLGVISLLPDVQRLYQYHGAEHKAIACYEAGGSLAAKEVQKFSRIHQRCGTAFLFLVILLSIVFFSFLPGPWWAKLSGRIFLLPVIAGFGYELLKLGDRYPQNILMKILTTPGLWLQKITTKEPTNQQVDVAIKALQGVV